MVIMNRYHVVPIKGKPTPRLVADQLLLCSRCRVVTLVTKDYVRRICLSWSGREQWFEIPRGFCPSCHMLHRMLPERQVPYKHYEKTVIATYLKYPPDEPIPEEVPEETVDLLNKPLPCDLTVNHWQEWRDNGYPRLPEHPSYDYFERNA